MYEVLNIDVFDMVKPLKYFMNPKISTDEVCVVEQNIRHVGIIVI